MTIILVLCIPLAFIAGGFVAYKGVHLGLKWQFQAKQEQAPTLDSPIQPIIDKMEQSHQKKYEDETSSILHEYLNGVEER
jgi:hypothetical protein